MYGHELLLLYNVLWGLAASLTLFPASGRLADLQSRRGALKLTFPRVASLINIFINQQ